jgi:MoaA/NifB/PqqE/SkfB family radical SAM enzyme
MISRRNIARLCRKALADPAYAIRAFRQRWRAHRSYRRSDGWSAPPETVGLFLTFRCNLRCRMCGQWGPAGSAKGYPPETLKSRLSRGEIRALLDDVRSFRPAITLFGGEPMLHPEFTGIVEDMRAAGLRCNVITDATLLERFAETLVTLGLNEIIFSLDGPREVHDEIRDAPGTFDKAMAGFDVLLAAKRARRVRRPRIDLTSVVFESGCDRLPELIPIAEQLGADSLTVHHLILLRPRDLRPPQRRVRARIRSNLPRLGGLRRRHVARDRSRAGHRGPERDARGAFARCRLLLSEPHRRRGLPFASAGRYGFANVYGAV